VISQAASDAWLGKGRARLWRHRWEGKIAIGVMMGRWVEEGAELAAQAGGAIEDCCVACWRGRSRWRFACCSACAS